MYFTLQEKTTNFKWNVSKHFSNLENSEIQYIKLSISKLVMFND